MDLLAAMRIFVRVVERGNLSRAAKDLGLGQPTVSDRVERLERFLGVRLLLRSTRAVSCTDEGILFYQRSKIVLDAADEARAVVTLGNKIVRGRIRIAAPHGLGEVVLPEILTVIREHNPQLYIDLILNDEITDPVTEGVDISLRLGPISDGNFVARRLGHVRRVLVASPSYIEKHGLPEEPTDIVGHPFIRVTGLFNDGQLRLMSPSKSVRPTPINIVISTSHWRPVYELLLNGAGIGVLQEHVCVDALASRRLVRLLPDYTVPGFDLHALLPVTRPVPSKTQVVVKILEEYLPKAMARAADQAALDV
ncbi:LysR family transcriptional regulator [Burkholderia ubonensis]|uniref:LysR family transcriptional regulator n=1 Tax=Burkholderia ubonensis TaxID=101571 RepID=UPI00075AB43B|nr:LysR family transcriptional regulator [Burkholderia ubonensis]KWK01202.1 LysR family transcriptional regulator [Burkholderia ubonensis]KWK04328.1 LysR family transcriptional regulator [Burkholderia ubonensis]KWK17149.1 LysR family transcriptional regulator [Burkholderia ubonensis]KWK42706.1 LysR family transcriptional regulator [Burkholderia ubonensis]KWK54268.1 LysR family transcriptional regulator [Burkholderia ubonensis]